MNGAARPHGGRTLGKEVREAIADDFELLAYLHDREPDRKALNRLRAQPMQGWLGLRLCSDSGKAALSAFDEALERMPRRITKAILDGLAVDHANIYLLHRYSASPTESVWFDDDGLERQGAMFEVRKWYRSHGLTVQDALKRPDDHIVMELGFLAHLVRGSESPERLEKVSTFLDRHLLRWADRFCGRVAERCATSFFAGVALLTAAYLEELRDLLCELQGTPRWREEPVEDANPRPESAEPAPVYAPGLTPGW